MKRLLRTILSIPLRLLLPVTEFLPFPNRLRLLGALYRLDPCPWYGEDLVNETFNRTGPAEAKRLGREVFDREPSVEVAWATATAALYSDDLEGASEWCERARRIEPESELVLYLRMQLGEYFPELDGMAAAEEILRRPDACIGSTRRALAMKAEDRIRRQDWEAAEELVARIDQVERNAVPDRVRWVLAMARGDHQGAARMLERMKESDSEIEFGVEQVLGWYALGETEKARECVQAALDAGAKPRLFYLAHPAMAAAFFTAEELRMPLCESA